jgi:hypothetical protein
MTKTIVLLFCTASMLFSGCSAEQKDESLMSPPPLEQVKTLTQGDREKIAAFEKELFDIEKISKKAMTLVGNEVKQVITGEKDSVDAAALVDTAKGEAKKSLDNLVTKYVPAKLPPWFSKNLLDVKKGYSAAYTAKIESFAAIKRFIDEKSPSALLEYRQKAALADKQFQDAREKLAAVLKASGPAGENAVLSGKNSGE